MEIPNQVNLGPLEALLAKSRLVMNKVETEKPIKQTGGGEINENKKSYVSQNTPIYDESDEREPEYDSYVPTQGNSFQAPTNYTPEQIMASNLPQNVKEAMLKTPIPRFSSPPSNVSVEQISRMTKTPINEGRKVMNETSNKSDLITVSKKELKELINETLVTFLKGNYEKTITEATIAKTINLLIKEGKINTKRKTN
jgi:hypothetical protein